MEIYDVYEAPSERKIGTHKCKVCGAIGNLILREGKQFRTWFIECSNGHRPSIKKEIDDVFQVGDRIRIYHVPFGKDAKIDVTTYNEGVIINKEKGIINYHLDMKIDTAVYKNKPVIRTSWLYGHIVRYISSDDNTLELLTPQIKLMI